MSLAPYEALVDLAEQERTLALDGRWSELSDLLDRRADVMAQLPARDPDSARPLLERALAAHAQAHAAMGAARAGLLAELGDTGRTRSARPPRRCAPTATPSTSTASRPPRRPTASSTRRCRRCSRPATTSSSPRSGCASDGHVRRTGDLGHGPDRPTAAHGCHGGEP